MSKIIKKSSKRNTDRYLSDEKQFFALPTREQYPRLVKRGIIDFIIICVIVITLALIELPKTASLDIAVSPSEAEIIIGGKKFKNGTHKMTPGEYHVKITHSEFSEYETDLTLTKDETTNLWMCLTPNDPDTDWYERHPADQGVCQQYEDQLSEIYRAEERSDPIYKLTPFRNPSAGFEVHSDAKNDQGKIPLTIWIHGCAESYKTRAHDAFNRWVKAQKLELANYQITYYYVCEGITSDK